MKLDKAIEILTPLLDAEATPLTYPETEATRLGIEALKGIKKVRKTFRPYVFALLPSETED